MQKITWIAFIAVGALAVFCEFATAQSKTPLEESIAITEPFQQNVSARYRLFPTRNKWTFIELDTATGRLWQVQYSVSNDSGRFVINGKSLADNGRAGRFTLYQTSNIWNFILLDQEDGRTWQAQFSVSDDNAGIFPISNKTASNTSPSDDKLNSEFAARIKKEVPDWEEVDRTPSFHRFLEQNDSVTGRTRNETLMDAMRRYDADTAISIFNEFKRLRDLTED